MKITIPENWNEVLLKDYLEYWKRIKPYLNAEDEDLLNAVAIDTVLTQICKVDFETLKSLDANDAIVVKTEAAKLLAQSTQIPLVRFFTMEIDGEDVEFGFEPNLDEMSYGCYLDLAEASKDLWDNIYTFLATLYRPVVSKAGKRYRIADYNGTDFSMIPYFKNALTADIALGSVFFFLSLQRELLSAMMDYSGKILKSKKGLVAKMLGKTSVTNMEDLAVSLSSLEAILPSSTQLPTYQSTLASLLSSIQRSETILRKQNLNESTETTDDESKKFK